jgi:putative PIN family toxin of toxin-antitoxin system
VRVVLDSSVLVSSLLLAGIASQLVPLWQQGRITVLLSREIQEGYLRALTASQFRLSEADARELLEKSLLPYVQVIKPGLRVHVVKKDPSENKFLECAVAGKADALISGDKHLQVLRHYRRVRIQSPADFLRIFYQAER